jgi:hypothetical protein
VTTRHRIFLSLLVVLLVSACSSEVGVVRVQTGVVQGFVRVFGGGPIEPTPLPISPFSARVQVRTNGRVVASQQTLPGHKFHFSSEKHVVNVAPIDPSHRSRNVAPANSQSVIAASRRQDAQPNSSDAIDNSVAPTCVMPAAGFAPTARA